MPEIDLQSHEYGSHDPKSGKMRKQMSPKWHRNWFVVSLAPLAYLFWYRAELTPETLFGGTLVMALASGIMLHGWLREVY